MTSLRLIIVSILLAAVAFGQSDYDRGTWRHWIDADRDGFDARQEVLLRSSLVPVTWTVSTGGKHRVEKGLWICPYSGTLVYTASDLDVDHMVALQNAHQSGADSWSSDEKRDYANDLDDPHHLLAVLAKHNRAKGSKSPAEWRPPAREAWCEYGLAVARIKSRWRLTIPVTEAAAIVDMVATCPVLAWDLTAR